MGLVTKIGQIENTLSSILYVILQTDETDSLDNLLRWRRILCFQIIDVIKWTFINMRIQNIFNWILDILILKGHHTHLGCSALPCFVCPPPEDGYEGGPELWGHEAVEDEVEAARAQGQDVHQLPHLGDRLSLTSSGNVTNATHGDIAGQEEGFSQNGWQHSQYTLVKIDNFNHTIRC